MGTGEVDQGQRDGVGETLALDLPGMLIATAELSRVGAPSRVLGPAYRGIEFSRRFRDLGKRVVVAPVPGSRSPPPRRPNSGPLSARRARRARSAPNSGTVSASLVPVCRRSSSASRSPGSAVPSSPSSATTRAPPAGTSPRSSACPPMSARPDVCGGRTASAVASAGGRTARTSRRSTPTPTSSPSNAAAWSRAPPPASASTTCATRPISTRSATPKRPSTRSPASR
ncbi:hypothetical protein K4X33_06725 [Brevibacterium casei]|nr:hypothetical protein K4X33_06725 [Brevibacterium casei]